MSYFKRIHEARWVYAASFAVPIFAAFATAFTPYWPVGLTFFAYLFNDALWRHRTHEIRRKGEEQMAKITAEGSEAERRYERRMRVWTHAQRDPAYARRLMEAVRRFGAEAADDFPLPPAEN